MRSLNKDDRMDMVEFVERYTNVKLTEWQREYIRKIKKEDE